MRVSFLLVLLALAGCSTAADELATCHGPVFALNAGRWTPQPADLTIPKAGN